MTDDLVLTLDRIPPEPKSVLLYLLTRTNVDTVVGLTQQEMSRATRLSVGAVREALGWLESPTYRESQRKTSEEIAPFISLKKRSTYHMLYVLPPYVPERQEVPFTFDDTDQQRLATLEKEVMRLSAKRTQASSLSLYTRGDKKALIAEIESDLGRAVLIEEAYLLGGMIEKFGPDRVRSAWRRNAHTMPRPIVGLWAMFMKNAFGKPAKFESKETPVKYASIVRDEA